jgi:hypothetical protein
MPGHGWEHGQSPAELLLIDGAARALGAAADEGGNASPNRLTEVTKCRSCGDSDLREGGKTKN